MRLTVRVSPCFAPANKLALAASCICSAFKERVRCSWWVSVSLDEHHVLGSDRHLNDLMSSEKNHMYYDTSQNVITEGPGCIL